MDINIPFLDKLIDAIAHWLKKDRRKKLPYDKVVIGTYKNSFYAVDIRASIILGEQSSPSVDIFLDRITFIDPYCINCHRSLGMLRSSWQADYLQYGYKCSQCNKQIEKDRKELLNDIYSEVRKNYSNYWVTYRGEIERLTKGKDRKYKL